MLEVLLEFFLEFVFQFVVEWVAESGFRLLGRFLSNRIVRAMLGVVVGVGCGYGAGYWWGARLTERGRTAVPNSLWVSIGLAAIFVLLALSRLATGDESEEAWALESPARRALLPWRWSAARLFGFALINAAVAAGIAVGFDPQPVG